MSEVSLGVRFLLPRTDALPSALLPGLLPGRTVLGSPRSARRRWTPDAVGAPAWEPSREEDTDAQMEEAGDRMLVRRTLAFSRKLSAVSGRVTCAH